MESRSLEEENLIKVVRNLFRLEQLIPIDAIIKAMRNLFRQEKENKEIKDRMLRDIRNLFKLKKEKKVI